MIRWAPEEKSVKAREQLLESLRGRNIQACLRNTKESSVAEW